MHLCAMVITLVHGGILGNHSLIGLVALIPMNIYLFMCGWSSDAIRRGGLVGVINALGFLLQSALWFFIIHSILIGVAFLAIQVALSLKFFWLIYNDVKIEKEKDNNNN